jgi:hypothetical protein
LPSLISVVILSEAKDLFFAVPANLLGAAIGSEFENLHLAILFHRLRKQVLRFAQDDNFKISTSLARTMP